MALVTTFNKIEAKAKGIIVLGVGHDSGNDVYRIIAVDGTGKLKVEDA